MSVLVIAEAGVNHNGDLALAKELVDAAADAGADVVKFQTFVAERLVTANASKARYQIQADGKDESQFEMLKKLELTTKMHEELKGYCVRRGIEFLSTGFDIDSIDYLVSQGIKRFKVPSGEITNLPYLRHVGSYGKQVLLSTGMSRLGEIESAIDILETAGTARSQLTVLQCNTAYPTPPQDVNLRAMTNIGKTLGVAVGYSDHTQGIEISLAAVALGAIVIEKHLTLDRKLIGPDHKASLEPREFKQMIDSIRNIEIALGDGVKRPTQSELENVQIARKSLFAATSIKAGQRFTLENVMAKRPAIGINPMLWPEIEGKIAKKDFAQDEPITL